MEITLLLLPLLGAILCGWGWRLFGDTAATWIATLSSVGAAALAFWTVLTFDGPRVVALGRWIESGSLSTDWSILIDGLSAAMLLVTMTLVALLQVYAIGFMARDEDFPDGEVYRPRFFAFLSLFAFALGVLFTAENLLQLIFGWQAVAFVGFLLTGFYFRKPSANSGAMRAFVTGRVGDSALLVALAALFAVADSAVFSDILDTTTIAALRAEIWTVAGRDITAASAVGGLLALAAAFKAALIFAHISAPRSMDAPAPGAALIVVLGGLLVAVFVVLRLAPIFNAAPLAGLLMVGAGGLTTVFGAGAALAQRELKRVLAFASVSQGGVVFV
ncbi:MAG: proton-conducting transporter membrane subunit, partial [Pseudomonadota bacterium]